MLSIKNKAVTKFGKVFGVIQFVIIFSGFQLVTDCNHRIGKWRIDGGPAVKYVVDSNSLSTISMSIGSSSTALTDIKSAANAWQTQTGGTFNFVYAGGYNTDGSFHMGDYCSNAAGSIPNRIFASKTTPPHQSLTNPDVLAITATYYCENTYINGQYTIQAIKGFEMWINGAQTFTSGTPSYAGDNDLLATITHELGHGIGLMHNTTDGKIPWGVSSAYTDPPCDSHSAAGTASMCKYIYQDFNRILKNDDLSAFYTMYGPPPGTLHLYNQEDEGISQANGSDMLNENYWIKSSLGSPVSNFGDPSRAATVTTQWLDCHQNDLGYQTQDAFTDIYQYGDQIEMGLFLCKRCIYHFPFAFNDQAATRIRKINNSQVLSTRQQNFPDGVCVVTQKQLGTW